MKKKHIIGVDISKKTFDFHCYGQAVTPEPLSNNIKGFRQFEKWMKLKVGKEKQEVLIVMEYTGIYTYNIEHFLAERGWPYVKRPALDIKRSAGIRRGKTDSADARMISKYGWMQQDLLKPMQPMNDTLVELQQLMSYREKLVTDRAAQIGRLKELTGQMGDKLSQQISKSATFIIDVLTEEINDLEKAIKACLAKDEGLQSNYDLLTSISGIGFVIAVTFLITTENFTRFDNHRKFACYCGVAPFIYSSGTSIKGKTRVSQLANKKIKSLLTLAAFVAIRTDQDLKIKYEQKVQEGKSKMSVINMIRVKLIERIFTVIDRQTPYILKAAA
jgi:transposase